MTFISESPDFENIRRNPSEVSEYIGSSRIVTHSSEICTFENGEKYARLAVFPEPCSTSRRTFARAFIVSRNSRSHPQRFLPSEVDIVMVEIDDCFFDVFFEIAQRSRYARRNFADP